MAQRDAGIDGAEGNDQLEFAMLDRVVDDPSLQLQGTTSMRKTATVSSQQEELVDTARLR